LFSLRRPPRSPLFPTRRSSDLCRNIKDQCVLYQEDGPFAGCSLSRCAINMTMLEAEEKMREHLRGRTLAWLYEELARDLPEPIRDRKSTRLNSSHVKISYAVFC